ncbi:hypothetical protein OG889_37900 [Streptomyces sp. NBC_00481]|uniref:hypothetical protein n=1 Tax=unclassified Streptomyces TaxID=2593676 RepID=UPI002DD82524|nr:MULTISPECIES: hypothetical protein [unclassified Streptomyces]WRY99969.1 hypothetical protein OG889_37900 [Streptomyces sp. NBC_00481]
MESGCWLVTLPAIDGRQCVYRVYAPENALPADLFWEARHCHDESRLPRAWDLFDAALIRQVRQAPGYPGPLLTVHQY